MFQRHFKTIEVYTMKQKASVNNEVYNLLPCTLNSLK